jgi:proline iminopeptidase
MAILRRGVYPHSQSAAVGAALIALVSLGTCAGVAIAQSGASAKQYPRATIAAVQAIALGGIKELKAIEIGGVKQWISVRGINPANPLLLFVHGGPGSPMMPESWTFQRPWEDFFTVVQWDQRGAGKTFSTASRRPDESLSIDRMQSDTEQLIEWLLHTYGKKKLFLLGHSWGSILGLKVAQHRPELLFAYIGVGQVVNGRRNEVVGYRETLAQAQAAGNKQAIKELLAIAPYPEIVGQTPLQKTIIERKWDRFFGGMIYGKTDDDSAQIRTLSPDYTAYDEKSTELGEMSSVQVLLPQAAAVDFDAITQFECPVFFFAGADDRTTPESIVAEYYDKIQAPRKKFFKVDRAAHYVVNEAPGIVLVDLVTDVRPLFEDSVSH